MSRAQHQALFSTLADEIRVRLSDFVAAEPNCARAIDLATNAFLAQMCERGALPHSFIVTRLARWCGFSGVQLRLIACSIDALQVAIDVADNIADLESDRSQARDYYPAELLPTLVCVPTILIGEVLLCLGQEFSTGLDAARNILGVLTTMSGGQSERGYSHIRAVSGEQGKLLCLPLWLSEDPRVLARRESVETWALAFGLTWELLQEALETDSPEARARFRSAARRLQRAWPNHAPFGAGEELGPEFMGGQTVYL